MPDTDTKIDELEKQLLNDAKFQHILKFAPASQRELMTFELARYFTALIREADGCPCLLVEPCSYACSCAKSTMSGGCMRCAKYGSMEQRLNAASRLAALEPAPRQEGGKE